MKLQPDTLFANRYQLERLLGRGGFSEVWLAKDNWTHLRVALKVYAPGQGMDANGLQDFCGELAKAKAETEFEKYRIVQDQLYQSDFDHFLELESVVKKKADSKAK